MCASNYENFHFLSKISNLTYFFEKPTYWQFFISVEFTSRILNKNKIIAQTQK